MPELNDDLKDKGAGAGSSGSDQSGENKGASDSSNNNGAPAGGQSGSADQGGKKDDGEEMITIPKKKYDQTLTDLDNYRTGLIGKKAGERAGGASSDAGKTGDQNQGNQDQNGGGGNAPAPLDETKVREIAVQASNENLHKSNQKAANLAFLKAHPEFVDDAEWQKFVPYLTSRRGKDTSQTILADLEDSLLLYKKDNGQLDSYLEEQRKAGERQGEINAQANMGRSAGGVGDRSNVGGGNAPVVDETMARKFGNDPKKVSEIDKTVPKTPDGFTIDVAAPKK